MRFLHYGFYKDDRIEFICSQAEKMYQRSIAAKKRFFKATTYMK